MNYKIDNINLFLYELQKLSKIKKINDKDVYLHLINYEIPEKDRTKDLSNLFSVLINKYNKKLEIKEFDNNYQLQSKNFNNNKTNIKIHVPLCLNNIDINIDKIIKYLIKNKIEHKTKIYKHLRYDTLVIELSNKVEVSKITNYINATKEISDNTYKENPFYINDNKVYLTTGNTLSYDEILSKYIINYINECNIKENKANFDGFREFLYTSMVDFISKNDLSKQIKLLDNREELPSLLLSLEEITEILQLNLQDIKNNKNSIETFYAELEKFSNTNKDKYKEFTNKNLKESEKLLKEIINTMTNDYGFDYTKEALKRYKDNPNSTSSIEYITRKNSLRNKVKKQDTFRTYLNLFEEDELNNKIINSKPEIVEKQLIKTEKEMILEKVCKETYLSCQNYERNYSGKNQVAISLIKMQDNNFECITRKNNARTLAKEYLKPEEIKEIVEKTIEKNGYIVEEESDLYELYAKHIECLCN